MRIDRDFQNPRVIDALRHVDEETLLELLDDAELLEALKHEAQQGEPTRSASEFLAELRSEKLI